MYTFDLPSGTKVELREMTGHEEALLTNQRLMRDGSGVNKLLRNCIASLGDQAEITEQDTLDMLSGDRLFTLVRIRQITFGDECNLDLMCQNPKCGADNAAALDLSALTVTPYPPEREHLTKLPRSGSVVQWVPLDGNGEKRLAQIEDAGIHDGMLIRIRAIDEKPPTRNAVRGLCAADLNHLRSEFRSLEGGIDTEVRIVCAKCGSPIVTRLEAQPRFLFPMK